MIDRSVDWRSFGALIVAVLLVAGIAFVAGGPVGAQTLPPGGTFIDDDGNTHEGFIEAIAAAGITEGCDLNGPLYCPADPVTRGQMASFLARALDLPAASQDYFSDDAGSTHEDNINRIAEAGITLGFPDGTFQADGLVRRDQMASFLARGIIGLMPATQDYFTDDTGNTHEGNINVMAENEITLGCGTGLYCPDDNVRRDQMASFLGRGLGLTEMVPPPTSSTTSTSDGATTSSSEGTTSTSDASTTSTTADTGEQDWTVQVENNEFIPANLPIEVGDTVRFSKMSNGNHDVTFDDVTIGQNPEGTTSATFIWDVTFDDEGTFDYVCTVHESIGMTGTIVVSGSSP